MNSFCFMADDKINLIRELVHQMKFSRHAKEKILVIVTVYEPDPNLWVNLEKRR